MLSSLSVSEFAARLSADDMPPGGGSTAALSGLLAVGLLEMTVNYSLKSPKLVETWLFYRPNRRTWPVCILSWPF